MKYDLQTMLNNAVAVQRAEELKNSPQLLLGELILKLEAVDDKAKPLFIDLMDKRPKGIDSWRGIYAELAIQTEDFGNYDTDEVEQELPEYGITTYKQKQIGKENPTVGEWIEVLKENGFNVVYSHIDYGQNFLTYEPKKWDVILSNPPYKNKRIYWERCLSLGKPFALLLPLNILSDSLINKTMDGREKEFQLLIPSRRMRFFNNQTGVTGNQPTFKASYFGVNFFKQQIILSEMRTK